MNLNLLLKLNLSSIKPTIANGVQIIKNKLAPKYSLQIANKENINELKTNPIPPPVIVALKWDDLLLGLSIVGKYLQYIIVIK